QELERVLAAEQSRREADQPADPGLALERANWLKKLARFEEAGAACTEAAELYRVQGQPDGGKVDLALAGIHSTVNQYELALAACERAEQRCIEQGQPLYPTISVIRSMVCFRLGR